jgi:hypothetical protein
VSDVTRPTVEGFWMGDEWRELVDPEGSPTARQLLWLNAHGLLDLVTRGRVPAITKEQAAAAITLNRDEVSS